MKFRDRRNRWQLWVDDNMELLAVIIVIIFTIAVCSVLTGGCGENNRKLTSEWHKEEEAKIDNAVQELRLMGKWNEQWNKFNRLGDYGWRDNMNCGTKSIVEPCMSGGYTFSREAFNQLKVGDLSHDPHNTVKESFQQQQALRLRRP